jgi:Tol biopolymer transport system component
LADWVSRGRVAASCIVTAAAVAFACGATAAPASRSSGVALLTYVDASGGLCGMRADGSHRVRLLSSRRTIGGRLLSIRRTIGWPTWSADGRYLAFARATGFSPEDGPDQVKIFVANARGKVLWRFGGNQGNGEPIWSPDGQRIAYRFNYAHEFGLAVARMNGSDDHGVAVSPLSPGYGPEHPAWTPDGQRLAFDDFIDASKGIFTIGIVTVAPDGSDRRLLVARAIQPAFSPDGSKLAYVAINNAFQPEGIYIANADGSSPRPLTLSTNATAPTWSPNGKRIAFTRGDAIVVANPDGSNERVITSRPVSWPYVTGFVWSPDSKLIAFTRGPTSVVGNRPFSSSIVVARADGGGERVVVRRRSRESVQEPAWRPATALPRANRLPCAAPS